MGIFRKNNIFPSLGRLALAAVICAILLCDARAGLLWEDSFDGTSAIPAIGGVHVDVPGGKGWAPTKSGKSAGVFLEAPDRIEFPLAKDNTFNAAAGTLRLRVRYRPVVDSRAGVGWSSTLVDFLNPDRSTAIALYMEWDWGSYGIGTRLNFWGSNFRKDVYGFYIPLGFQAKPGQVVDLAFTWGPDPGRDNKVFVNGREPKEYFDTHDRRIAGRTASLAKYLTTVNILRIGIDSENGMRFPGGRAPAVDTVFDLIQLYDRPMTPEALGMVPTIRSVTDDSFKVVGISGKLVAGDTVTAELVALAGGRASFDLGKVKDIPMQEVPETAGGPGTPPVAAGTYRGSHTIRPGDDFENGRVLGHFATPDNTAAEPVASASVWTIETKPRVTFQSDKRDLPADSATKARVRLAAKDANGNPVKGRRIKLTLATTDEYTGTVGAGDFGKEVGASVETRWRGETDDWGQVEFDYTAGFAAKTVLLTAKDLDSGGVTVDFLTAYKEASIDIALTPPVSRAAARRGLQYILKIEATRTELTADGRSRSVIRATLQDPTGKAVPGDPVTFALSSDNGKINVVKGITDASGVATAEYIAGKKIGIVVVTATAALRNVSASVSIILLADAPAKIYLKARPATLPADGFSRADIDVKVTDINDNPNKDTKVEFRVSRGAGRLEYPERVTDKFGDALNRFTAGTTPGIASILATVRSRVPTDAELSRARNVLFVPYLAEGDRIRIEKWLKKKGDAVAAGEPVVEYAFGRGGDIRTLVAPYDGTMGEVFVEYWDDAEVGQTLAVIVPAPK